MPEKRVSQAARRELPPVEGADFDGQSERAERVVEPVRRNFYGPGDDRLVARIDRETFERLRARYERIGLLESGSSASPRLYSQAPADAQPPPAQVPL